MARVVTYLCDVCGKRPGEEWVIVPPEGKPFAIDLCEQDAKAALEWRERGRDTKAPARKYHKFHISEVAPA